MIFDVGGGTEAKESELPALEQLVAMGYEYITQAELNKTRTDYRDVLLYDRLEYAIRRLNPNFDDDGIHDAIQNFLAQNGNLSGCLLHAASIHDGNAHLQLLELLLVPPHVDVGSLVIPGDGSAPHRLHQKVARTEVLPDCFLLFFGVHGIVSGPHQLETHVGQVDRYLDTVFGFCLPVVFLFQQERCVCAGRALSVQRVEAGKVPGKQNQNCRC